MRPTAIWMSGSFMAGRRSFDQVPSPASRRWPKWCLTLLFPHFSKHFPIACCFFCSDVLARPAPSEIFCQTSGPLLHAVPECAISFDEVLHVLHVLLVTHHASYI